MVVELVRSAPDGKIGVILPAIFWSLSITTEALLVAAAAVGFSIELLVSRLAASVWLVCCACAGIRSLDFDYAVALRGSGSGSQPSSWQFAVGMGFATGISLYFWTLAVYEFGAGALRAGKPSSGFLSSLSVCLLIPFREEILYRLGVQSFLAHRWRGLSYSSAFAILGSSLLFSTGHSGIADLAGIKLVQMSPIAIALGALFLRCGLVGSTIAHASLNSLLWLVPVW